MNNIIKLIDLLKKLYALLTGKQRRQSVLIVLITVFASIVETLCVSVVLPLVQTILYSNGFHVDSVIEDAFELFGASTYRERLVFTIMIVIGAFLIKNFLLIGLSFFRANYSKRINISIASKMIDAYLSKGYIWLRNVNTSDLLRGCSEAGNAVQITVYNFLKIVSEFLTAVMIIIYIAIADITTIAVMVFFVLLCTILIISIFRERVQRAGREAYVHLANANKWLLQLFQGIKEVLVMHNQEFFISKYKDNYNKKLNAMTNQTIASEIPAYCIEMICIIGIMTCVGIKLISLNNPMDYIPLLAIIVMGVFRIMPSLGRITSYLNTMLYEVPAVNDAYNNIVQYKPQVISVIDSKNEEGSRFAEELSIENVSYKYPDSEERVLERVSLHIKKGDSIAIIGASGSGKSTLADLILGLLIPENGSITVDGSNIHDSTVLWSDIIGYVPQSIYLLDDTIKRNIAVGKDDKDIDDEMIIRSLKKAQIYDFVINLKDGLDTVIGERGTRLSGGQAQRLAIARALYRDPDIIIFDEATSALDGDTEKAVIDAIDNLKSEKTMIIIAHRLSTIKNCDRVYEVKNGQVLLTEIEGKL